MEPEHVQEARRIIRDWELRDGHSTYVMCLDGGDLGYQAACSDCDWLGTAFLRGDEELGTEASRSHKRNAQDETREHRQATAREQK